MAAIAAILKKIGAYLLPLGLDWLWQKVSLLMEEYKAAKAIKEKNKQAREGLEKGETPEERDRAAEDVTRKF